METTVSVKSVDTSSILAPFFCKTGSLHPSPLINDRLPAPYQCCSMFWEVFHSAVIQYWMGEGWYCCREQRILWRSHHYGWKKCHVKSMCQLLYLSLIVDHENIINITVFILQKIGFIIKNVTECIVELYKHAGILRTREKCIEKPSAFRTSRVFLKIPKCLIYTCNSTMHEDKFFISFVKC